MATRKSILILIMAFVMVMSPRLMPFEDNIAIGAEEDQTKPVVDYAYVDRGILKLSISDNERLAKIPIIYRLDNKYSSHEIRLDDDVYIYDGNRRSGSVYEIEVDIPSTIFLTVRDYAENENTYKFTIKEDNTPLTNDVPEFILEILAENRQSLVTTYKGFDRIFELEYGKIVNALGLYEEIIEDNYYSYNKNDIRIKVSGLSTDRDGNIKLDKYGIFKVTMTHNKDKTFEEIAYILIKPDWRNAEDRRTPSNISPYITYKNRIKVIDYLRYEDEANSKKKSKIDTSYMLIYDEETNQLYGMNEQIDLELNKLYNFTILNFETNSQQDFYIMSQEKVRSTNRNFSDVDKDHWASRDISSLVSKGLISGYSDGSFRPSGNITIKEFMSILSRQIAAKPKDAQPIVGNVVVPVAPTSWGYIESKSILDRIPSSELSKFNYLDLDRPINREEVAFLMDKALDLGIAYKGPSRPLNDIALSSYPSEIRKLVDLGLISGYEDGSFKPKNNITRAEIAAIFNRIK